VIDCHRSTANSETGPSRGGASRRLSSSRTPLLGLEFIKNPEAVSKKTEEAIKHLGVGPNRQSVEKLAAQVVAYRIESRNTNGDSAAGILKQKGLSAAVRAMVEQYEDQH
jgi:hypothetical protein